MQGRNGPHPGSPLSANVNEIPSSFLEVDDFVVEPLSVRRLELSAIPLLSPLLNLQTKKHTNNDDDQIQPYRRPVLSRNMVDNSAEKHAPILEPAAISPGTTILSLLYYFGMDGLRRPVQCNSAADFHAFCTAGKTISRAFGG